MEVLRNIRIGYVIREHTMKFDYGERVQVIEFKGTQKSVDEMINNFPYEKLVIYDSDHGFVVDRPCGTRFKKGDHYFIRVDNESSTLSGA